MLLCSLFFLTDWKLLTSILAWISKSNFSLLSFVATIKVGLPLSTGNKLLYSFVSIFLREHSSSVKSWGWLDIFFWSNFYFNMIRLLASLTYYKFLPAKNLSREKALLAWLYSSLMLLFCIYLNYAVWASRLFRAVLRLLDELPSIEDPCSLFLTAASSLLLSESLSLSTLLTDRLPSALVLGFFWTLSFRSLRLWDIQ